MNSASSNVGSTRLKHAEVVAPEVSEMTKWMPENSVELDWALILDPNFDIWF